MKTNFIVACVLFLVGVISCALITCAVFFGRFDIHTHRIMELYFIGSFLSAILGAWKMYVISSESE